MKRHERNGHESVFKQNLTWVYLNFSKINTFDAPARISSLFAIYTNTMFMHLEACMSLQLLSLHTLPSMGLCNHLSGSLANGQNSKHRVNSRHLWENTRIGDSYALQTLDLQLVIHNDKLILGHITHLGGASGMVNRMCCPTSIFRQLLVCSDGRAGGNFALDPVAEGGLCGDLSGGFEAGDDGGGVVAFRVGEVAEVEGGFYCGVGGGEEEAAAGAGAGDVGGHAEGVDGGVVAETVVDVLVCVFLGEL
jgi:hypothetical protein